MHIVFGGVVFLSRYITIVLVCSNRNPISCAATQTLFLLKDSFMLYVRHLYGY